MDSSTTRVPETVPGGQTHLYVAAVEYRGVLKRLAAGVDGLRQQAKIVAADPEAIANATLCYRCLEDASMRLGKMMQALDGGVSVYDRKTTVGAPFQVAGHVSGCRIEIGEPCSCGAGSQNSTATALAENSVINRTADGAAVHADGHTENGGAGESGGLMNTNGGTDGNSPR